MQHYSESSEAGRANIDRVAELEARDNVGK